MEPRKCQICDPWETFIQLRARVWQKAVKYLMNESMARMRAQLKRGRYGYEYGNSSCAGDFDRLCVSIGSPNDEKRHVRRERDVRFVLGALQWRLLGDGAH